MENNETVQTEEQKPKLKKLQIDPDAIRRMEDLVAIISAMGLIFEERYEGEMKTIYHLCNDITGLETESETESK